MVSATEISDTWYRIEVEGENAAWRYQQWTTLILGIEAMRPLLDGACRMKIAHTGIEEVPKRKKRPHIAMGSSNGANRLPPDVRNPEKKESNTR